MLKTESERKTVCCHSVSFEQRKRTTDKLLQKANEGILEFNTYFTRLNIRVTLVNINVKGKETAFNAVKWLMLHNLREKACENSFGEEMTHW